MANLWAGRQEKVVASEQLILSWICYSCFLPLSWSSAIPSQFKWLGQTHHNVKVIFLTFFPLWLTYWAERKLTGRKYEEDRGQYCIPVLTNISGAGVSRKNLQSAFTFHLQMEHTGEIVKVRASSHLTKPRYELVTHRKILFFCIYVYFWFYTYAYMYIEFFLSYRHLM